MRRRERRCRRISTPSFAGARLLRRRRRRNDPDRDRADSGSRSPLDALRSAGRWIGGAGDVRSESERCAESRGESQSVPPDEPVIAPAGWVVQEDLPGPRLPTDRSGRGDLRLPASSPDRAVCSRPRTAPGGRRLPGSSSTARLGRVIPMPETTPAARRFMLDLPHRAATRRRRNRRRPRLSPGTISRCRCSWGSAPKRATASCASSRMSSRATPSPSPTPPRRRRRRPGRASPPRSLG